MLENFTHFSHGITISSLGAVWEGFSQNGFTCEVKVDETKKLASPGFEFILAWAYKTSSSNCLLAFEAGITTQEIMNKKTSVI